MAGRKRFKCLFSYPQAMAADLRDKGVPPWSEGGEFDSFALGIQHARELAEERQMPVEVTCMGQRMTLYPEKIGY